jgi:hypothetical protein
MHHKIFDKAGSTYAVSRILSKVGRALWASCVGARKIPCLNLRCQSKR